jgi:hypothetical protein
MEQLRRGQCRRRGGAASVNASGRRSSALSRRPEVSEPPVTVGASGNAEQHLHLAWECAAGERRQRGRPHGDGGTEADVVFLTTCSVCLRGRFEDYSIMMVEGPIQWQTSEKGRVPLALPQLHSWSWHSGGNCTRWQSYNNKKLGATRCHHCLCNPVDVLAGLWACCRRASFRPGGILLHVVSVFLSQFDHVFNNIMCFMRA